MPKKKVQTDDNVEIELWRKPKVIEKTALPSTTLDLRIAQGRFPSPVKISGSRSIAWSSIAVRQWIREQVERSRTGAA